LFSISTQNCNDVVRVVPAVSALFDTETSADEFEVPASSEFKSVAALGTDGVEDADCPIRIGSTVPHQDILFFPSSIIL
jgi:hypothetical protein